jgi:molecular chaperone GrpE (heat shock protein)
MSFLQFFRKKTQCHAGIIEHFAEISERLRRIETRQKETSLQLEDIDGFLQSNGSETTLVDALIRLADTIGDFFYFAAADSDSPLFEQARMMWNSAQNAIRTAGLETIDAADEPFDFRLHSAESTEEDNALPNGYVIKTLKHGYIYRDEIVRRALVVVNKISAPLDTCFTEEADYESGD